MAVELADLETFLVVADELHFARSAERLHVSVARVSQRVRAFERHIGGALFERTSRRVRLTPLGAELREELAPAYEHVLSVIADAGTTARGTIGPVRVGFTPTTAGEALNRLVLDFESIEPQCPVVLREVPIARPFEPLRAGEVDVVVNWLVADGPDLTLGPELERQNRMLAVAIDHRLASRDQVCAEDLGDWLIPNMDQFDRSLREAFVPLRTPAGRPVRFHNQPTDTVAEVIACVARGQAVHPTVTSMARMLHRNDVALIPLPDLAPLRLGLIWCTAHENARIRAIAAVAVASAEARAAAG